MPRQKSEYSDALNELARAAERASQLYDEASLLLPAIAFWLRAINSPQSWYVHQLASAAQAEVETNDVPADGDVDNADLLLTSFRESFISVSGMLGREGTSRVSHSQSMASQNICWAQTGTMPASEGIPLEVSGLLERYSEILLEKLRSSSGQL